MGAADLGEDLLDKAERKEGISLQMIPRLDQRIYRRRLRVRHRGKLDLKAMVDGGGEQIHRDRPKAEEIVAHLLMEGPFGTEDLTPPTESVRQDIQETRNKLGEQMNT